MWSADLPEGNETGKIRWELVPYTRGMGLDLGCGPFKAFPHFIGVDNLTDKRLFGTKFQPDFVSSCETLPMFATGSMAFVYSSHLLEHIQDYKAALKEWWRLVKPGGHLCLYLPHKDFYPNIGTYGANPDHKHDFMPEDIIEAMKECMALGAWDLVENQTRGEDDEYSFFQVYRKITGGKWRMSCNEPKPAKTCAIVRYGAFGDLLQTSSIFPQLKAEGYHITLYSASRGYEVVKTDPHIDRAILQDVDQVPNHWLTEFWAHLAKKYDKFVNLSESVEGTFLAQPERIQAKWPHEVRHLMMNRNYLEFTHALAGLPYKPAQKFYATEEEKAWAKKERAKLDSPFVIMWSLAGSSVHKTYPHQDTIFARVLTRYPKAKIVTVGDELSKMLEIGWEQEPRVICRAGVWSIRQSLAFIKEADLVIGPETGVLNAAAFSATPKIVTLSHSSVENLARDWVNCTSLTPKNTPCYPCHMMHFNFDNCAPGMMDIEGTPQRVGALCQVNITPDDMWAAIENVVAQSRKAA